MDPLSTSCAATLVVAEGYLPWTFAALGGSNSARRSSARCVTSLLRVAMDSKGRFRSNIDQILGPER
jgi:hypothetical protein